MRKLSWLVVTSFVTLSVEVLATWSSKECPPGQYREKNWRREWHCFYCDYGEVSPGGKSRSCTACVAGEEYPDQEHTQCLPCECDPLASCTLSQGCVCPEGYRGDGLSSRHGSGCSANSCMPSTSGCHSLATCDPERQNKCYCDEGLWGDGVHTCEPSSYALCLPLKDPEDATESFRKKIVKRMNPVAFRPANEEFSPHSTKLTEEETILSAFLQEGWAAQTQGVAFCFLFKSELLALSVLNYDDRKWRNVLRKIDVDSATVNYRTHNSHSHGDDDDENSFVFEISGVEYVPNCGLRSGCWQVDFLYSEAQPGSINFFYVPKVPGEGLVQHTDALIDGRFVNPVYTSSFLDTFSVSNFPCPLSGNAQQITCCLKDFQQAFRTSEDLSLQIQHLDAQTDCMAIPEPTSGTTGFSDGLSMLHNSVAGQFEGLVSNTSHVSWVDVPAHTLKLLRRATFFLDEEELKTSAGLLEGVPGLRTRTTTFVGMARLRPSSLNGSSSRNEELYSILRQQHLLELTKSDALTITVHGANSQSFLETVHMTLHQLQDLSGSGSFWQWVRVVFTLRPGFVSRNTWVIPPLSVRFRKIVHGVAEAVEGLEVWQYPCNGRSTSFKQSFYDAAGEFWCRHSIAMCAQPIVVGLADVDLRMLSMDIPLGRDFIRLDQASYTLDTRVEVELAVAAKDSTTKQLAETLIRSSVAILPGVKNLYCESLASAANIAEVAEVTLLVGMVSSAEAIREPEVQVFNNLHEGIAGATESNMPSVAKAEFRTTPSIESGLITLVLRGAKTYFDQASTQRLSLELQDVISIHMLDSSLLKELSEAAAGDSGLQLFDITFNGALDDGATLTPSSWLLSEMGCSFWDPSTVEKCVLRRDYSNGKSTATAIEVSGNSHDDERAFMRSILGQSEFADSRATAFKQAVNRKYSIAGPDSLLDGRFSRAFWINPAFNWLSQSGRQFLSQAVLLVALVTVKENGISSRHVLHSSHQMPSGLASNGFSVLAFSAKTAPSIEDQLATILHVDKEQISRWSVEVKLDLVKACSPHQKLKNMLGRDLSSILWSATSPTTHIDIFHLSIPDQGVICLGELDSRRMEGYEPTALANVEMTIVFAADTAPIINLELVLSHSAITTIQGISLPPTLTIDNTFVGERESGDLDQLEILLCVGVGCCVLLLLITIFWPVKRDDQLSGAEKSSQQLILSVADKDVPHTVLARSILCNTTTKQFRAASSPVSGSREDSALVFARTRSLPSLATRNLPRPPDTIWRPGSDGDLTADQSGTPSIKTAFEKTMDMDRNEAALAAVDRHEAEQNLTWINASDAFIERATPTLSPESATRVFRIA